MKTSITSISARLLLCGAALGASLPAWSEPKPMGNENREITAGVEYSITEFKASSGIYKSPKSSKIYLDGAKDFVPYSDAQHQNLVPLEALDNTGGMQFFMGEEGVTYYFYTSFPMNSDIFVLYQEGVCDKPLKYNLIQPAPNEIVDFNNYPDLVLTFNQDIKLKENSALITFANRLTASKESVKVTASANGQTLRVPMYNTLKNYLASGAIKTQDEFSVTISGLTSTMGAPYEYADAEGNIVFNFLCGSLPVVVVKQSIPDPFLSYWTPGAPEGILTMEFDSKLIDDGKTFVELGWGNPEGGDGEYYTEKIICNIEGNRLSVDLTGKLRTPASMTPMYPTASYDFITLNVNNVRDEYGVPVASGDQGTVGSYTFMSSYRLITRNNLIAEFSPASGNMLEDVDNVNIWMTGLDAIEFDGFTLTATGKDNTVTTRTLLKSQIKETIVDSNEAEYDFIIPTDIKSSAKRVVITLANIKSLDGYDHNNEIRCVYGGFAVLYAEPSNNEEIEILKADSKITIETNLSKIYPNLYIEYQIIDTNPENMDPVVKSAAWMDRQSDGSYVAEIPQDVKLYAGHDYKVEFTAWQDGLTRNTDPENDLGSDFIIWKGLTPAYHYSSITMTGVTPATDEYISDDTNEITVTFDGPVYLGNYVENDEPLQTFINVGQGETMPFKAVTPTDPATIDGIVCANKWTLTLPDGYVASLNAPLEIGFTAYDQENVQLRGTTGMDENSFFNLSWNVAGQFDSVEVTAVSELSPLGNVKEFKVYNKNGVGMSWNIPIDQAAVTFNGKEVAHVADVVYPNIDFSETMTEITIVLDEELCDNGDYVLTIPAEYFEIGEGLETKKSLEVIYKFTIVNGSAVESVFGEEWVTVYKPDGMLLYEKADKAVLTTLSPGLYIINGKKIMIK